MIPERLLISTVSIVLGGLMVLVAVLDWDWYYQLPKAQWLQKAWGRAAVRVVYAALGLMLIGIGVGVAGGWL